MGILLIKVIKESKRKNKKKITYFLNSFSGDLIDVFSELLGVLLAFRQKKKILQKQ